METSFCLFVPPVPFLSPLSFASFFFIHQPFLSFPFFALSFSGYFAGMRKEEQGGGVGVMRCRKHVT